MADAALTAAQAQTVRLPGEAATAALIAAQANALLELDRGSKTAAPSAPPRRNQSPLDTVIQIPAVLDEHLGRARASDRTVATPALRGVCVVEPRNGGPHGQYAGAQ
jgi:hypothetical protein